MCAVDSTVCFVVCLTLSEDAPAIYQQDGIVCTHLPPVSFVLVTDAHNFLPFCVLYAGYFLFAFIVHTLFGCYGTMLWITESRCMLVCCAVLCCVESVCDAPSHVQLG